MKFLVHDSVELSAALLRVSKAPDETQRGGLNARVRVYATAGSVEFLARDDVVAAVTRSPADVSVEGGCCVPVKLLAAVLMWAPPGRIEIEQTAARIEFSAPGWRRSLCAVEETDIAHLPVCVSALTAIPSAALRFLIERTSHAADTSLDRPDRACIVVSHCGTGLESRASDGCRAAYARVNVECDALPQLAIHQHALRELRQVLSTEDSPNVHIGISDSHIFLQTPLSKIAALRSRICAPNLSAAFGHSSASTCRVSSQAIINALDSAYETTGKSEIQLRMTADCLILHAEDSVRGSTTDDVAAVRSGPDLSISVSNRFVKDAIRAIGNEEVVIGGTTPLAALVVRPAEAEDSEMVIMAMHYPS